jgi:DNA-binding CsgD family transcriptional regulator
VDHQRRSRPARVFVGRLPEQAELMAALTAARGGEPRVVILQGEAGIGKSSLVFKFLGDQQGIPVITASGDTAETALPYGVIRQLAGGATAISSSAIAGLGLLAEGPRADTDPLAAGVEFLSLISSLQQKAQAVAVVVEDLQWVDLQSARALLFACRRLGADHVLMILTCRPEGTSGLGEGWARFVAGDRRAVPLMLNGLDVEELGSLCRELGRRLSPRALQRLAAHTGGSPLLARALLAELNDEGLRIADGTFRVPRSLTDLIVARLATLSGTARDLVVAASVLGDHCALADAASLAGLEDPAAALDEAELKDFLLEQRTYLGPVISFAHPLVRDAVYGDVGVELRSRLHLRAAAILGGQEALAHRAAAAVGPDPSLASDLSAAAVMAAAAGKLLVAARYLQQAATVTTRGPDRDERVLSAFELLVRAADSAAAATARPLIEQLPATARRDVALGQLALLSARPLDAQTLLRTAWDAHDPATEASAGKEAAFGLGMVLGMSGSFTEATMWLDRALSHAAGSEPWYDGARCVRAIPFVLSGAASQAFNLFRDLPQRAAMVPAPHTDALTYRGIIRLWTDDLQAAADDLGEVASRISGGLQVRFPSQPLAFLAETEFRRGRWDDSHSHGELAVSLARDADRDYDLAFAHSLTAPVPACRGDWVIAVGHVEAAEAAARTFGGFAAIFAASARGILGFARADPAETLRGAALALSVPEIDSYDDPIAFWWRPMQVWALIRSGRLSEAEDNLTTFQSRAVDRGERSALIHATWLQGLLAMSRGDLDHADQVMRDGRNTSDDLSFPFYSALLDLEHGRCLSRLRRRRDAIDALQAAHETFTALAAHPFRQTSESALAALGSRRHSGGDPSLPGLTTQELRVARLVASGMSNREVATQLYLSPKTVEYHLAHAFTKLGLNDRHQLAARIRGLEDP